ncbi:MAG: sodium:solute symporter family protein [Planctomycetaceae bacterium]|nr:sodium:solute symporter family protein [Planctomycetaceae bacterium]
MHWLDYGVLLGYFLVMASVGVWAMRRVKVQEDYFMGGRSFGKLMQTFAAFGAGTGSSDPVNTGRTTFTSGMSGMWSVMYWLFVTPFYWIAGVWYRRMRHLTLGDWYVERYESKSLGAAYAVFGLIFYVVYGSMLFSAIGKVAAPLVGTGTIMIGGSAVGIEYVLVPIIGVVVLVYGMLGGLRAAYITDLIQGLCIIVLSVMLVPFGLRALVEKYGTDPATQSLFDGFAILHQQLPAEHFHVLGGANSSEFPLYRIVAVVIINLVGVVVQPHFIATGGGSAKTEMNARVGLVLGNFLKRFCTVGWVLTALIALALYANSPELIADPDKTWGVASRELLGPGLTGLMLACLLAALMSSVDAYMIVGSGLVVRNIYAAFVNPTASEREYVMLARFTGVFVVGGGVLVSLMSMNVFQQLQWTWVIPVLFAAPFWVGMYWRRGTTAAAWSTVAFSALLFFILPAVTPMLFSHLRAQYHDTNQLIQTTSTRVAAPSDVARREASILLTEQQRAKWQADLEQARQATDADRAEKITEIEQKISGLNQPQPLQVGAQISEISMSGGQSVFWSRLQPVDDQGNARNDLQPMPIGPPEQVDANTTRILLAYPANVKLKGEGNFRLDFLLYKWCGMDFTNKSNPILSTLELPPKIIAPFLVMIGVSFVTRPNRKESLDRYFSKMKTPVDPDPNADQRALETALASPEVNEAKKLFPGSSLEFQRPSAFDLLGFLACFGVCFGVIGLAVWLANIGS